MDVTLLTESRYYIQYAGPCTNGSNVVRACHKPWSRLCKANEANLRNKSVERSLLYVQRAASTECYNRTARIVHGTCRKKQIGVYPCETNTILCTITGQHSLSSTRKRTVDDNLHKTGSCVQHVLTYVLVETLQTA